MDELASKYQDHVRFVFVYGPEGHPRLLRDAVGEDEPFAEHTSDQQRRRAANTFRDRFKVRRRVLVDKLSDKCLRERIVGHFGEYNPVIVVDTAGRIVHAEEWLSAAALDQFLECYLTR